MRVNNVSINTSTQTIVSTSLILLFLGVMLYVIIFQFASPVEFFQAVLNSEDSDVKFLFLMLMAVPFILVGSIIYSCVERNKSLKLMKYLGFNLRYVDFFNNRIDFCFVDSKYNISCSYEDIERLEMVLHTIQVRGKYGNSYTVVSEVELFFTLLNGKKFSIKNTPLNKFNFICKIINYTRGVKAFSYRFTGTGKSDIMTEKIDDYLRTGIKQILSTKEENSLKTMSLLMFGIGTFFFFSFLNFIIDEIPRGDFGLLYAIAPFFLFIIVAIIMDVYLILDKINDRKFHIEHKSEEFISKIPCELVVGIEFIVLAVMVFILSSALMSAFDNKKALNATEFNELVVNSPAEFNDLRKDEIYNIRKGYVKNSLFASNNYEPNETVFGGIEDYKPWWGSQECRPLNYNGDYHESIEGDSKQSIQINNPNALVGLSSPFIPWNVEAEDFCTSEYAKFLPQSIKYDKKDKLIVAEYGVSKKFPKIYVNISNERVRYPIQLSGLNALDFGYKYVYAFNKENIRMAYPENITENVEMFRDYIHVGSSCGYAGGCNNISPMQNDKMITVENLPAQIDLKLWKKQPVNPAQKADMYYRIKFVPIN